MDQDAAFQFHLEWPAPGAVVRGPVVWLRGWLVGRNGCDFIDLRVRVGAQVHYGLLGLPRTDLAAHFKSERAWLPAAFVIGVPLPEGTAGLDLEALDACGRWHGLPALTLTVSAEGAACPQVEGTVVADAGGSWTGRGAHQPFVGELGEPVEIPLEPSARVNVFGWLAHRDQALQAVLATTDLLVFNHVAHRLAGDSAAAKMAAAGAQDVWFRGGVDAPPTLAGPACLRVYGQLSDGSVHLCFATRFWPSAVGATVSPAPPVSERLVAVERSQLPPLPSGRPRRVLFGTANLEEDEATWRALEAGRFLVAGHDWAVRLVTGSDGPMRAKFAAAGIEVQVLDTGPLFAAKEPGAIETAVAALQRQIWWGGLDAVAVFDPSCFWLMTAARNGGLPVLFDCSSGTAVEPPPEAPAGLKAAMISGWKTAGRVCHATNARPTLQGGWSGGIPADVVPSWVGTRGPAGGGDRRFVVAPVGSAAAQGAAVLLRAADWLARRGVALPWRIALTKLSGEAEEMLLVQDAVFNRPAIMAVEPVALDEAAAWVSPASGNHPVHALLEAAASGVPIIATASPEVTTHFSTDEALIVPRGNPVALAHALADLAANPAAAARRAARARFRVESTGVDAPLRWQAGLEAMLVAPR